MVVFRYVDIFLGTVSLLSLVSLECGAANQERRGVLWFLITSIAVLLLYWCWFVYLRHGVREREASEEVKMMFLLIINILMSIGTSVRCSSGRRSGVAVRAVDCWQ